MCGIAGIINKQSGAIVDGSKIEKMLEGLHHRGPDDHGIYLNDNVAIGHKRLSIIDLSKLGHQPMISSDGRYVISYNGEVYNYIELKDTLISKGHSFISKTDTEVILAAYMEWGEECLDKFNERLFYGKEN